MQRFQRLIKKLNRPIPNIDAFEKFAEENNLKYLRNMKEPNHFPPYFFNAGKDDLNLLKEFRNREIVIPLLPDINPKIYWRSITGEYARIYKELLDPYEIKYTTIGSINVLEDDKVKHLYFDCVYEPIYSENSKLNEIEYTDMLNGEIEIEYTDMLNAVGFTILKYFLLNGKEQCPLSRLFNSCRHCIILGIKSKNDNFKLIPCTILLEGIKFELMPFIFLLKGVKIKPSCTIPNFLEGIKVRIVK
jgi:hypothetical protein